MLKFGVNNPKTSHISRYHNIKSMFAYIELFVLIFHHSQFLNTVIILIVMKNANFLIFFQTLNVFLSSDLIIFIISISLSLVIIRKICELLIRCSLYYPKEFNICFLKGDKFAKYLSDPTNPKYPTDPFC